MKLFEKHFLQIFGIILVVLTFIFDVMFFFVSYPERNHDILNMIAGVINTVGFASVVSFFYGSSKGSSDKDKQIAELKDEKQNPTI